MTCINSTQCYYNCQLEVFRTEEGTVSTQCGCSPGNNIKRPNIDDKCYSPDITG